jgi:transposase InsO family protein
VLARAVRDKNLYKLVVCKQMVCANTAHTGKASAQLWHERLGHLSKQGMDKLKPLVEGLDGLQSPCQLELCKGCMQGKQQRQAFPKCSASHAKHVLELVHTDICGPMRTASLGGSRYFMTFIDDKSRKVFVYFLKSRGEALAKFQDFQHMAEKATGRHIKVLRSDNGGEYVSKAFALYLQQQGIRHQTTAPYSPEQNGVAERANRTLMEAARSMLHARAMDHKFWGEAVATAAYLRNRSSTKAVPDMTPEEAWSGSRPSISHLKVFGCRVYVHVPKEKRSKLDAKTRECIMVGYCEDSKAYRLYCPFSGRLVKSRDVVFDEQWEPTSTTPTNTPPSNGTLVLEEEKDVEHSKQQPSNEQMEGSMMEAAKSKESVADQEDVREAQPQAPFQGLSELQEGEGTTAVRRSGRIRHAPGEWWKASSASHGDSTRHQANLAMGSEPQTLQQALSSTDAQQWRQAMDEEYESLTKNCTWQLVPLPRGRKAIGNKWVFKIKYHADGTVERYKARLVAKGYAQTQGIDYNETFAPVAKFTTIRSILAIAAMEDLEVHQMDVKTAFLNG